MDEPGTSRRPRLADELKVTESPAHIRDLGRPVRVTLAATLSRAALVHIGARLWEAMGEAAPVHIVAISASGVLTAATAFLDPAYATRLSSFTIVKPEYGFDALSLRAGPGEPLYVVDNSVHSGATARSAITAVAAHAPVDGFIKLIDYQDELERTVAAEIRASTGVPVLSLFRIDELFPKATPAR